MPIRTTNETLKKRYNLEQHTIAKHSGLGSQMAEYGLIVRYPKPIQMNKLIFRNGVSHCGGCVNIKISQLKSVCFNFVFVNKFLYKLQRINNNNNNNRKKWKKKFPRHSEALARATMQLNSLKNGLHQKLNEKKKKTKEEIRLSVVSINININEYVKLAACRRETKSTNFSIDRKSAFCVSLTLNEIDRYANSFRCACRLTVVNAAAVACCSLSPLLFSFVPAVVGSLVGVI